LNFKTAGATFGKQVNAVKKHVEQISDNEKKLLLAKGQLPIDLEELIFSLQKEHINVEYVVSSCFEMAGDQQIKVLLDLTLTTELVEEGQVREFIRAVQDTRKKLEFAS